MTNHRDIHQEITDNIIEMLDSLDLAEYQSPFQMGTGLRPSINPTTGQMYKGINSIILWITQYTKNYSSNEWATFKQWKEQGATVKKGSKSSNIVFYKNRVLEEKTATGEIEEINIPVIRHYNVFNAEQVEGYKAEPQETAFDLGTVEKIENIEDFVLNSKADIRHEGRSAFYAPEADYINMPEEQFFYETDQTATENYYATLLHELTHWTGNKNRLNRVQQTVEGNKEDYAFEELIAELGSAFLCSNFGIMNAERKDHALYIKSWLRALKNDKKFIFRASAQAQKAFDYLIEQAVA